MTLPEHHTHGWNQRKKEPPVFQVLLLLLGFALLAFLFSNI